MCANALVHGGVCGCTPWVYMCVHEWGPCAHACWGRHVQHSAGGASGVRSLLGLSENQPPTQPSLGLCHMTRVHPWGRHNEETWARGGAKAVPPAAPGRLLGSQSCARGEKSEAVSPEARPHAVQCEGLGPESRRDFRWPRPRSREAVAQGRSWVPGARIALQGLVPGQTGR